MRVDFGIIINGCAQVHADTLGEVDSEAAVEVDLSTGYSRWIVGWQVGPYPDVGGAIEARFNGRLERLVGQLDATEYVFAFVIESSANGNVHR